VEAEPLQPGEVCVTAVISYFTAALERLFNASAAPANASAAPADASAAPANAQQPFCKAGWEQMVLQRIVLEPLNASEPQFSAFGKRVSRAFAKANVPMCNQLRRPRRASTSLWRRGQARPQAIWLEVAGLGVTS
jgi:hypothetical protein